MIDYGRCPRCDHLMLPVLDRSPCGHADEPVVEPLSDRGLVYSWTVFHLGESPRTIVMADFFGGGLRVTAPLLGSDTVEIGDEVIAVQGEDTSYALRRV